MGQSSSNRSRYNNLRDNPISNHSVDSPSVVPSSTSGVSPPPFPRPSPNPHIPSTASRFSPPSPPPPPPPPPPLPPPNYAFAANGSYSPSPYGQPNLCPPPPSNVYPRFNVGGYMPIMTNRPSYPFYPNGNMNWPGIPPMPATPPFPSLPPPFVKSQQVTRIRNEVNLHKNSIRIELDKENPDQYLVNFTFDAMVDGSITICYFAKEGTNCCFSPQYPEIHVPVRIPFQKGLGQNFCQPSGTGIDLGFFDLNDLSKPEENDVFPLVISAEAFVPPSLANTHLGQTPTTGPTQVTKAVIEKKNDEPFQVKVIKQMLWVDRVCYELREIYGLGNSMKEDTSGDDEGKDCVICLSEPRDTTVMPCRHMCLCRECAKLLRLQSNRCPICRQPVDEFLEIDVRNAG